MRKITAKFKRLGGKRVLFGLRKRILGRVIVMAFISVKGYYKENGDQFFFVKREGVGNEIVFS